MMNIEPPSTQQPSTTSGFERLGFFPTNTLNHCKVVFNIGQGESSSSPKVEKRRYKRIVIDSESYSQE